MVRKERRKKKEKREKKRLHQKKGITATKTMLTVLARELTHIYLSRKKSCVRKIFQKNLGISLHSWNRRMHVCITSVLEN